MKPGITESWQWTDDNISKLNTLVDNAESPIDWTYIANSIAPTGNKHGPSELACQAKVAANICREYADNTSTVEIAPSWTQAEVSNA